MFRGLWLAWWEKKMTKVSLFSVPFKVKLALKIAALFYNNFEVQRKSINERKDWTSFLLETNYRLKVPWYRANFKIEVEE